MPSGTRGRPTRGLCAAETTTTRRPRGRRRPATNPSTEEGYIPRLPGLPARLPRARSSCPCPALGELSSGRHLLGTQPGGREGWDELPRSVLAVISGNGAVLFPPHSPAVPSEAPIATGGGRLPGGGVGIGCALRACPGPMAAVALVDLARVSGVHSRREWGVAGPLLRLHFFCCCDPQITPSLRS